MSHVSFRLTCVALFVSLVQLAHADDLRTVAFIGQPMPGAADGTAFEGFSNPVMNNSGRVAFRAQGSSLAGIWSETAGGLSLVALAGQNAAGTSNGEKFGSFQSTVILNDAGEVAFSADLMLGEGGVTLANQKGIWAKADNGIRLVARTGSQSPGTPLGAVFSDLSLPVLNNLGEVAFRGELFYNSGGVTDENFRGIWSEAGGIPRLVARMGGQVPGFAAGSIFQNFTAPVLNDVGRTYFKADIANAGPVFYGIWYDQAGALVPVIRSPFPAVGSGTNFVGFGPPAINDAGDVAFVGLLPGSGSFGQINHGLWTIQNGSFSLVALKDTPAAGTTGGKLFSDFSNPVINSQGQVAFVGGLHVMAGNFPLIVGEGVWLYDEGALELVAEMRTDSFVLNAAGQVAIQGTFGGIWAQDIHGTLQAIALPGDQIDVDDGPGIDLRTIQAARFFGESGNEDGRASAFNDRGQLVFRASFSDGSQGVFVSNRVATIPEPSAIATTLMFALLFCGRIRSRRSTNEIFSD